MTRLPARPRAPRLAALLAVLAVTAGCSGSALSAPPSSPSSSSTRPTTSSPPPSPPPPPPIVGACRELSYGDLSHYSNDNPQIPCTKPHTTYTFAVQTLPEQVSVVGASIGNKSIQQAAAAGCRSAFDRFVGGDPATRARSRVSVTYFLPDQAGYDAGADWVRCDVVALQTARTLAPLPRKLQGLLDDVKSLRQYGVCSRGVPGKPHTALVMCSEPHVYRAVTTIRLGAATSPYPGEAVAGKQGQHRCGTYLEGRLGKDAGYMFGWTYPTVSDWASGQRFGYCWLKSSR